MSIADVFSSLLAVQARKFTFGPLKDASYSGQWFNAKPHGRGSLKAVQRGDFQVDYVGEFREGKMHG